MENNASMSYSILHVDHIIYWSYYICFFIMCWLYYVLIIFVKFEEIENEAGVAFSSGKGFYWSEERVWWTTWWDDLWGKQPLRVIAFTYIRGLGWEIAAAPESAHACVFIMLGVDLLCRDMVSVFQHCKHFWMGVSAWLQQDDGVTSALPNLTVSFSDTFKMRKH